MSRLEKKTFAFVCRQDAASFQIRNAIQSYLERRGWIHNYMRPELVICVGGDGTIIRAIHHYYYLLDETYFVGIHTGTLGFLTDYDRTEVGRFLEDLEKKEFECDYCSIIEVSGDHMESCFALNEIKIGSFSKTVNYDLYIDGEKFEKVVGSGICISTQAGSTAVNRSLMGAVVDDGLDILQLCEIMPVSHHGFHSLQNPYIMNSKRVITVWSEDFSSSMLTYDHLDRELKGSGKITIKTSDKKVRFARFRPYSYLRRLINLR